MPRIGTPLATLIAIASAKRLLPQPPSPYSNVTPAFSINGCRRNRGRSATGTDISSMTLSPVRYLDWLIFVT